MGWEGPGWAVLLPRGLGDGPHFLILTHRTYPAACLPPGSRYLSCASFQVQAKTLNASLPGDNGCDQVRGAHVAASGRSCSAIL